MTTNVQTPTVAEEALEVLSQIGVPRKLFKHGALEVRALRVRVGGAGREAEAMPAVQAVPVEGGGPEGLKRAGRARTRGEQAMAAVGSLSSPRARRGHRRPGYERLTHVGRPPRSSFPLTEGSVRGR